METKPRWVWCWGLCCGQFGLSSRGTFWGYLEILKNPRPYASGLSLVWVWLDSTPGFSQKCPLAGPQPHEDDTFLDNPFEPVALLRAEPQACHFGFCRHLEGWTGLHCFIITTGNPGPDTSQAEVPAWLSIYTVAHTLHLQPCSLPSPWEQPRLLLSLQAPVFFLLWSRSPFLVYKHVLMSTCLEQREIVSTVFNQKQSDFSMSDPVNDMWFH